MVIKSFLYSRKNYSFGMILLVLGLLVMQLGCGSLKKRSEIAKEQNQGAESSQPDPHKEILDPVDSPTEAEDMASPKKMIQAPKLGVVLGPGGAKALAHAGVLNSLESKGIPVDYVVGLEWGALVAGQYAKQPKAKKVEWELSKIKAQDFAKESSFFSHRRSEKDVDQFLKKYLVGGEKRVEDFSVKFMCPSLSLKGGYIKWVERGKLRVVLSRCLTYTPFFQAKHHWVSSATSLKKAVSVLKSRGAEVVLVVDVFNQGDIAKKDQGLSLAQKTLWQELRNTLDQQIDELQGEEKVEIVRVVTNQYGIFDFNHVGPLILSGQRAGSSVAVDLIQKYGY